MSGCGICSDRGYFLGTNGSVAIARACECARSCGVCGGAGHIYVTREETFSEKVGARKYEVLASCTCRTRSSRFERFALAGIPAVHAQASFENYVCGTPEQSHAKETAKLFALDYRRGSSSKGFVLSGPVGTGKSHLLAAALIHLNLELGVDARYTEISFLFATIRRGFQEGKSGGEIIAPLSEVEVLAIDELGKGRGSPFELETLDELIARRYNAGRTTLFATNYSLEFDRKGIPATPTGHRRTQDLVATGSAHEILRERVGQRIFSRLAEMCAFVELPPTASDFRRARHEVQFGGSRRR